MHFSIIRPISTLFLFFSLFSSYSWSQEIRMVTSEWEPFYASTHESGGVVTELANAAFERAGHSTTIEWHPWLRAMKLVANGGSDVVLGAYYSEERAKAFHFSDPFFTIDIGFVALKETNITKYQDLKSLSPFLIGAMRGWAYTDEFDAADYLKKEYVINQIVVTRMLFARRVDMVAISIPVFQHEASLLRYHDMSEVVVLTPLLDTKKLHIMFSLRNPNHLQLAEDFNRGLAEIRADGTFGRIMAKHHF